MVSLLLFPGQGAQKVGMGKDLAEAFPRARETFAAVDAALGEPLSRLMWEGPEERLQLTEHTQPAILAHSAAVLAVLGERLQTGKVAGAAGHSLGEYSAYHAAGSLSLSEAARLVRTRGELMRDAGERRPGSMAAVLGLDTAAVEQACREASTETELAVPANLNTSEQTVISGDPAAVVRAGEACKAAGAKRVVPLKVSGAFHSPLMAPAAAGLRAALAEAHVADPRFPVVANATAEPVRTARDGRRLLVEQLTAPVRWVACLEELARLGGEEDGPVRFLEIGPGNVLGGLLKRVRPDAAYAAVGTRAGLERLLA
jgi:[acyl-carrier-protein] S-malonyltransferase